MKKLVILLTVALYWSIGFAQQDQKAKNILKKVTETTQGYSTIQATFNYIMENKAEGIHEENNGQILLKGDQFHLSLDELGMEIFNNGETVWTYMKDAGEVTIADADDEMNEMMDPSKLFTIYEEGFAYKFVEEKTVGGQEAYVIDLFPDDKEIEYTKIRIQIDKKRMLIMKAEMIGSEGNNYIVEVKNIETDVPATTADFKFDPLKHPDVEKIDLR
ncbi:outer membrane lipoprotein carrier protein LolA [uncultured Sunxiuqinia sp.]|uniref:LolA family protein n=1 Tax=uncultured Sunxiuqinia sp. TaxID=1573825 RepID=UPI002AA6AE37|nr:outer membrane lipoprotein carrier protein LolA [uncultured Sunxiuqinia sp.]